MGIQRVKHTLTLLLYKHQYSAGSVWVQPVPKSLDICVNLLTEASCMCWEFWGHASSSYFLLSVRRTYSKNCFLPFISINIPVPTRAKKQLGLQQLWGNIAQAFLDLREGSVFVQFKGEAKILSFMYFYQNQCSHLCSVHVQIFTQYALNLF